MVGSLISAVPKSKLNEYQVAIAFWDFAKINLSQSRITKPSHFIRHATISSISLKTCVLSVLAATNTIGVFGQRHFCTTRSIDFNIGSKRSLN